MPIPRGTCAAWRVRGILYAMSSPRRPAPLDSFAPPAVPPGASSGAPARPGELAQAGAPSAPASAPSLVVPEHGRGALLTAGQPGNAGGGSDVAKAKARLRKRFRRLLGDSLAALERRLTLDEYSAGATAGETGAAGVGGAIVPPIALDELIALTNTAARYGLGTQHEVEQVTEVRHVVMMPPRRSLADMLAEAAQRAQSAPMAPDAIEGATSTAQAGPRALPPGCVGEVAPPARGCDAAE